MPSVRKHFTDKGEDGDEKDKIGRKFDALPLGEKRFRACVVFMQFLRDNLDDLELSALNYCKVENKHWNSSMRQEERWVLHHLKANGEVGRPVIPGDVEHFMCTLYQMLAFTLPHRRANMAQPAQQHCYPTMQKWAQNKEQSTWVRSKRCINAFVSMVDKGLWSAISEQFESINEEDLRTGLDQYFAQASEETLEEDPENGGETVEVNPENGDNGTRRSKRLRMSRVTDDGTLLAC